MTKNLSLNSADYEDVSEPDTENYENDHEYDSVNNIFNNSKSVKLKLRNKPLFSKPLPNMVKSKSGNETQYYISKKLKYIDLLKSFKVWDNKEFLAAKERFNKSF